MDTEALAGVDPETGEVIDPDALKGSLLPAPRGMPGHEGLAAARRRRTALDTPQEVYSSIQAEVRKMELAGERMGELRKLLHGFYLDDGSYVAGVEFEYAEVYDEQVRILYFKCNDESIPKAERPRWPGEDVRKSIVNEHIPEEKRQKLEALKGEMKTLENYIKVCNGRMTGLVTLLAYLKEEARMANFGGQG